MFPNSHFEKAITITQFSGTLSPSGMLKVFKWLARAGLRIVKCVINGCYQPLAKQSTGEKGGARWSWGGGVKAYGPVTVAGSPGVLRERRQADRSERGSGRQMRRRHGADRRLARVAGGPRRRQGGGRGMAQQTEAGNCTAEHEAFPARLCHSSFLFLFLWGGGSPHTLLFFVPPKALIPSGRHLTPQTNCLCGRVTDSKAAKGSNYCPTSVFICTDAISHCNSAHASHASPASN